MTTPFNLPKSPLSPEQTQELARLVAMKPQMEKYIADAKAAGIDVSEAEANYKENIARLEKLHSVYKDKHK